MARNTRRFVCQSCGAIASKWSGRCDACGEWNTITEEAGEISGVGAGPGAAIPRGRRIDLVGLKGESPELPRVTAGIDEFDRATGGGLVPGSAILVGGDPGIGKSTLLLQALAAIARKGEPVVYISGEEAVAQVRLRARRMGLDDSGVLLAAETNLADILATLESGPPPTVVVIDSIQTVWSPAIEAAPGTVSQVRATAQGLIRFAKARGVCVILVGHVTKDGQIAGPRVVEHMVDTVLYFEGERGHQFRILRAVKNRFGPTDEIGVFEMTGAGLAEVGNPSRLFLGDRGTDTPGSAVFAGIEGTRPLLVEIQALVAATALGTPRRAVVGWDQSRLAMVLAVLDAHCGLAFGGHDVYLNVAGGLKIREPAADLAVAAALVSSLCGVALPGETVYFGEASLSGSLRSVSQTEARLKEAAKLGFTGAVIASAGSAAAPDRGGPMTVDHVDNLAGLVARIAASGPGQPHRSGS
jgi:DNA repair protein RadA/Sms